jgi:dTDP-4-amino-4,6-dideoxygalactose transaminase
MRKTIHISLSPNLEKDDVLLALKLLFNPIRWYGLQEIEELEKSFATQYGKEYYALAVNSGRSAEYLILQALEISRIHSVAIQALTCVAVPNPVLWLGAEPLYIDVDNNFNMDIEDLQKKINKSVKVIIIQHSFGIPAEVDKIISLAKKRHVHVLEDCTVALGASYRGKKVGTFSDAAFFSFGRDKIISSVFGGMILTKNKNLYLKMKDARDKLNWPKPGWLIQQLLHPILTSMILSVYNLGFSKLRLGKILLFLSQNLRILSKAIYKEETVGHRPSNFPQKMPGALAKMALNQLHKLNNFNNIRVKSAKMYYQFLDDKKFILPSFNKGSVWLRVPIIVSNPEALLKYMSSYNIILGDWYKKPVVPVKDLNLVKYTKGSCPNAEHYASHMVNLPTNPTLKDYDIENVIFLLKQWQNIQLN